MLFISAKSHLREYRICATRNTSVAIKRPRNDSGNTYLDALEDSFEEAVVKFIKDQEAELGEGCWLQHIQSTAFQHPEKPSGAKSQEKLRTMLNAMPSLVEEFDKESEQISFKVRASIAARSVRPSSAVVPSTAIDPPTAIELVQGAVDDLDLALRCHDEIYDNHLTPSGKTVVIPVHRWEELRQYINAARARLT